MSSTESTLRKPRKESLSEISSLVKRTSVDITIPLELTPFPFITNSSDFVNLLKHIPIPNDNSEKGYWKNKIEYLLITIGFVTGVGSLGHFPTILIRHGAGFYLILLLLFNLICSYPLMIIELFIGQFTGMGTSRCFEYCPIISGLGWAMNIVSFIKAIDGAVIMSWILIYIGNAFKNPMPWTHCNNSFNNEHCVSFAERLIIDFDSNSNESSIFQFWDIEVTGEYYIHKSASPKTSTALALLMVIFIVTIISISGIKINGKLIYFTIIYPFVALFQLFILSCVIPGAWNGILYYIYPDISYLYNPYKSIKVIEYLVYSSALGCGSFITLGSLNKFNDNIHYYVIISVTVSIIIMFFTGFITFSALGYLSHVTDISMETLLRNDQAYFIIFPKVYSSIESSNFWCFTVFLMALSINLNALNIFVNVILVSIEDMWTKLHTHKYKFKMITFVTLCLYCCCLPFATPYGFHLIFNFFHFICLNGQCLMVILEIFSVVFLYGINKFEYDYTLMTGHTISLFSKVCFYLTGPIVLGAFIFAIKDNSKIIEAGSSHYYPEPSWIYVLLLLIPVLAKGTYIVFIYYKKKVIKRSPWKQYFLSLISPPLTWGPRSKLQWLRSVIYTNKMIRYKNDVEFNWKYRDLQKISDICRENDSTKEIKRF